MTTLTQKTTDILGTQDEHERNERRALSVSHAVIGVLIANGFIAVDYSQDEYWENHRTAVEATAQVLLDFDVFGV